MRIRFKEAVILTYASEVVVDEPLPSYWQTEEVELVIIHEVLHLSHTIGWWVSLCGIASTLK
jgi:hypothetical protein